MFKKNIDDTGRVIRLAIAVALFAIALWQDSWIAALLGVFTLAEAYFSWCVFYQLMGWNSCPINKQKK